MTKQCDTNRPTALPPLPATPGIGETGWENEGGATAAPERAGLYADLLAEADRRRRVADTVIVQGMVALRDPQP